MEGEDSSFHAVIPLECQDTLLYCSLLSSFISRFGVMLAFLFNIPRYIDPYAVTILYGYGFGAVMHYCAPSTTG